MKRILAFKAENCTGCRICEAMCSLTHGLGLNPARARLKVLRIDESGFDLPGICRHCEEPPCRDACPVEAIVRDPETDAVLIKEEVCIGCLACSQACPYGAIAWDEERRVVTKCDLCQGRPSCVENCPKSALVYERADVLHALGQERKLRQLAAALARSTDPER